MAKTTLTADTITDEQIRDLMQSAADPLDVDHDANNGVIQECSTALAAPLGSLRRVNARARCAEILNARSAEGNS